MFNEESKTTSLVVFNPQLPWKCSFYNTFSSALSSVFIIIFIFLTLYFSKILYLFYQRYQEKKKDEIRMLVEKIIDILQSSVGEEAVEKYVVINHVRDMILPVTERKSEFLF